MLTTAGVRRAGAAALDLCDVACGRFEAFWELRLAPWDFAAGLLIVHTAAAGNRYWQGTNDTYEIELRRTDSTPERIVRRAVEPVPVRGAYLDSLRRVQAAENGPEAAKGIAPPRDSR